MTKHERIAEQTFDDGDAAVARIAEIYERNTAFIRKNFDAFLEGIAPDERVRAYYPEIAIETTSHARLDSRYAYGFVSGPGAHATTLTQPDLFGRYLRQQVALLIRNHGVPVTVRESEIPIPVHFAYPDGITVPPDGAFPEGRPLRDLFDVPNLEITDDSIVNGNYVVEPDGPAPLALFTAPRIDYSLHRLQHYTATAPKYFQNFVLFTNYQFYVDAFCTLARKLMDEGSPDYDCFVEPGNVVTHNARDGKAVREGVPVSRLPQMPAYHLVSGDSSGITMVNIGVGPSNAKTITDHVAVLRPHAWLMLGHCAGLRNSQKLGDYVLAHGYVREDHVLDADLPTWVPIPALAEIQIALEMAVQQVTDLSGYDLKRIMRTGTVATIDNRNWELRDHREPVERFSQSRAIALDMESATIAANGFRFRVPYGTLLCISDKPLHGELKLPGMANDFYRSQVDQHLTIGMRTMEILRAMPSDRLHSRKLRTFSEAAFQ